MINLLFSQFACTIPNKSILGFPTWYKYLEGVSANGSQCSPAITNINDTWLIVIALLEILFRLAAIVAVGFIVYAGFLYTTSQGEPEKTAQAKNTIINALVGLAIAVSATAIVSFLTRSFK